MAGKHRFSVRLAFIVAVFVIVVQGLPPGAPTVRAADPSAVSSA